MRRLALLLLLCASPAMAEDWYVSKTGSDANGCTSEVDECLSITKGISVMSAGDILFVKAGAYFEDVCIFGLNGASGTEYTISNFGSDVVVVDGTGVTHTNSCGAATNNGVVAVRDSSWLVIDGIDAINGPPGVRAFMFRDSSNLILRHCRGDDSLSGLRLTSSSNVTVEDCTFDGNAHRGIDSISSSNITVQRVIASNTGGDGGSGENDGFGGDFQNSNLYIDVVAFDNDEQGWDTSGHGIPASVSTTLINSVIYNNGALLNTSGIKIGGCTSDDILIENVLTYGNDESGVGVIATASNTLFNKVTSWNNTDGFRFDAASCHPDCNDLCPPADGNAVTNSISYDLEDSLTVNAGNTNFSANYNLYFLDVDDPDAFSVFSGGYSLAQWATYKSESGFDANSPTPANPMFVNTADPDGADNTFLTCDDGLLLQAGSPAIGAADDGGNLGYRVAGCGGSPTGIPVGATVVGRNPGISLRQERPEFSWARAAIAMDAMTHEERIAMLRAWVAHRKEVAPTAGWDYACQHGVGHCPESHSRQMAQQRLAILQPAPFQGACP